MNICFSFDVSLKNEKFECSWQSEEGKPEDKLEESEMETDLDDDLDVSE